MEIKREIYLQKLIKRRNNGMVKIITGIRRCGKSYLLFKIFYEYLISQGVAEDHIIRIALDDLENESLCEYHALYGKIKSLLTDDDMYYVLLDEIQLVPQFEKVLNTLLHKENVDTYVTGSNSRFLSSDIVTEFRGRGDEVRVYPLSFSEFLPVSGREKAGAFAEYMMYGGMPAAVLTDDFEERRNYLQNLYETLYLKDIKERYRIDDLENFDELINVIASAIGSLTNPSKLENTFRSAKNISLSHARIKFYLDCLKEAFIIDSALRYDIKGKKYISTPLKYYFVDTGLRNAKIGFRQYEETHLMENVIYNELKVRGFSVDVGIIELNTKNDKGISSRKQLEVDFVANQGSRRYYIQSALSVADSEKREQETASLRRIPDSFKKIVVVKDEIPLWHNEDGITFINVYDFLLDSGSLDL